MAVASFSLGRLCADVFPTGCDKGSGGQGNTSTTGINFNHHQAHLGDVVQVFPTLGMVGPALPQFGGACEALNATGTVYIASGLLVKFLDNVTLDPGLIYKCPTNSAPPCTVGPYNVTITPALVGAGVVYPEGAIGGLANTVRALQWSFSSHIRSNPNGFETLDKFDTASIVIVHPCVQVVKQCVLPQGRACYAPGEAVVFTGLVTNCGDINLTNVIAIDTRTGRLVLNDPVSGSPLPTNGSGGITLSVGAYATYRAFYVPTLVESCQGGTTNSVTVTGTDTSDIGGPNAFVTNSTRASCPICVVPCISVIKRCGRNPLVLGRPEAFTICVVNCGNISVTNISVADAMLGGTVTNIAFLAPGQQLCLTRFITPRECRTYTNSATASGVSICGTPLSATGNCVFTVICPPRICVTKEVACLVGSNLCGAFGKDATGYKVVGPSRTNLPAFCYRITVSNCGVVGLTNVTVIDDKFGDLTAEFKPCIADVFAPGTQCTFTFRTELEFDQTNTVMASGRSVATGQTTTAQDSATGHVFRAGITCNKIVTSPDDLDGNTNDNHVLFQCGSGQHLVSYSVVVANTGDADLTNIVIMDPTLAGLCTLPGPFSLAAGARTNISLCGNIPFYCGTAGGGTNNNCGNPVLGVATVCTVLELDGHSVSITGPPGGIQGDVCIGPNGKLSITGEEYVTGNIKLAPGATYSKSGSGTIGGVVQNNVNLSPQISAAYAAASSAAAMPCTQTFASINLGGKTNTITGVVGVNVICVQDIVLNTATVRFTGPAGATFIVNIRGKLVLNGSSHLVAAGGVKPKDILYNVIGIGDAVAFTGGGGGVNCCASTADGTLLAPQRNINLSPGLVNGQVISGLDISIVSGSSVRCPPGCTPVTAVNTIIINAEISESQSNTNIIRACVRNINGQPITASSTCSATVECVAIKAGELAPPGVVPFKQVSGNFPVPEP